MQNRGVLIIGKTIYDQIRHPNSEVFARNPGGSGYYASISASFFCRPTLLTKVGCDFDRKELGRLSALGIETKYIEKLGTPSLVWKAIYRSPTQYDTVSLDNYEVTDCSIHDIPNPLAGGLSHAYITEDDPDIQTALLNNLRGAQTLLDTKKYWAQEQPKALMNALRLSSMAVMNEEEAEAVFGKKDPVDWARDIRELGPNISIINLADKGSIMFAGKEVYSIIGALNKSPVDVTGAGDTFAGAFLANIFIGKKPEEAMLTASVMSSFVIEDFGAARMFHLTSGEILERYRQAVAMGLLRKE